MIKNTTLSISVFAAWLLSLGLAGCSGMEGFARQKSLFPVESHVEPAPVTITNVTSQPAGAVDAEAARMWKDPVFQKQFVASYGVNAEIEPRLMPEEITLLEKIRPLMSDDLPRAKALLERQIKSDSSAVLDFTLGNIHFQQGQMNEAIACYEKAKKKFPSYRRVYRNLGLIHAGAGRYDDAIAAFTKMIELGGGDAYSYGLLGVAYAAKQDFQAAEVAYRNALLLQPQSTDWRLGLTRCVFRQRKYEDASALLDVLIERYPDKEDFWLLQANTYLGMKQPLKAAQNLEAIDRMGKASPDSLYMLGDIYVTEDLPDLAANAYCRAIKAEANGVAGRATSQPEPRPASQPAQGEQTPLSKSVHCAEVLASRGAVPQARQVAAQIRRVWADHVDEGDRRRLLKLEARLSMAGDASSSESAKVLEEIIALDPLDGDALMLLGQHYSRMGQEDPNALDRAIFYYERAEGIEAFEVGARIRHAQVLISMRPPRYADAVPLLRRAQELKPREDVARYLEQVERFARTSPQTPAAAGERSGMPAPASAPARKPEPATGKGP